MTQFQKRLCAKEAASYIGLSHSTLAKYRTTGEGPPFMKIGRKVLYDVAVLDDWLASRVHQSTSAYSN